MRSSEEFSCFKGISSLAQKIVETGRDGVYILVYRLLTLALNLLVATAIVERAVSVMKIVKNQFRNKMGDQWINDSLIAYIEKDMFGTIPNEPIMHRFQDMRNRRGVL